ESTRVGGRAVAGCVSDVAAIADHLGADRFFASGGSGGGPHTLACAALLPDRVRGCAAIACPAPWGAEGLDWLAGQGPENLEEFGAALEGPEALETYLVRESGPLGAVSDPDEMIKALGEGLLPDVDRAAISGEYATTLIASMKRAVMKGVWGWFDDDMAFLHDWGFSLDAIEVPVALWQGRLDKMVPFAYREEAKTHLPGGVSSSWQTWPPHPIYVARGRGSHVWDIDGNEYVDYHNGYGVMVMGHAHPKIVEAVHRRVELGTHFAQPTED